MFFVSHSFAPRFSSKLTGGSRASNSPCFPLSDNTDARNQDSYSLFAKTTEIGRSERVFFAILSNSGASCAGQSLSLSNRRSIPPTPPTCLAAAFTASSITCGLSILLRGILIGALEVSRINSGAIDFTMSFNNIGNASTSPNPSTTQAILRSVKHFLQSQRVRLLIRVRALILLSSLVRFGSFVTFRLKYKSHQKQLSGSHRPLGRLV